MRGGATELAKLVQITSISLCVFFNVVVGNISNISDIMYICSFHGDYFDQVSLISCL